MFFIGRNKHKRFKEKCKNEILQVVLYQTGRSCFEPIVLISVFVMTVMMAVVDGFVVAAVVVDVAAAAAATAIRCVKKE